MEAVKFHKFPGELEIGDEILAKHGSVYMLRLPYKVRGGYIFVLEDENLTRFKLFVEEGDSAPLIPVMTVQSDVNKLSSYSIGHRLEMSIYDLMGKCRRYRK
jgi:hypothetical protein